MTKLDEGMIEAWIADDPDSQSRAEIEALLTTYRAGGDDAAEAGAELADRFDGTLKFGTAGLRGRLGAGPNRMNRAVVIRAAAGLVAFLQEKVGKDFHLVVGYDAATGPSSLRLTPPQSPSLPEVAHPCSIRLCRRRSQLSPSNI